jgi:GMP synthase (glutamine-hydrolysing)
LLVVKCGDVAAPVRIVHGDYDRWLAAALGPRVRLAVVPVHLGAALPDPRRFDAVVTTGSPRSVLERAPWMVRAGDALLEAAEQGVPVLAICFGAQLVAAALGAEVRRSPRGRELGTVACALTPEGRADPLFAGLPPVVEVQATHEDEVARAPRGAVRLAANDHSAVQAFRVGRRLWAVQFHPELPPEALSALARARAPLLAEEARARGEDPAERLRAILAGIRGTRWGARILANFLRAQRASAASPSAYGRRTMPRSVTIAPTSASGVTSKAG